MDDYRYLTCFYLCFQVARWTITGITPVFTCVFRSLDGRLQVSHLFLPVFTCVFRSLDGRLQVSHLFLPVFLPVFSGR